MRNKGLDIIRTTAILMVLISHGRMFFAQYLDLSFLSIFGVLGVELFFVLSGFLIGGIVINDIVKSQEFGSLIQFYIRRWFRTFPAYYLVFLVLVVLSISTNKPFYYEHMMFIQNIEPRHIEFFSVSWSLSVEEWFYLTIPLLLLGTLKIFKADRTKVFFIFCLIIIGASFIARWYVVSFFNPSWDFGVRKQIYLRMDSIMLGVIAAGIKAFYNDFYRRLNNKALLASGLFGILACIAYFVTNIQLLDTSYFARVFLFGFISISFVLITLAFEKSRRINNSTHVGMSVFQYLALTSYSVYLIHFDLFLYINEKYNVAQDIRFSIVLFVITIVILFVLSNTLYHFWEKPFMKIRDNINVWKRKDTISRTI